MNANQRQDAPFSVTRGEAPEPGAATGPLAGLPGQDSTAGAAWDGIPWPGLERIDPYAGPAESDIDQKDPDRLAGFDVSDLGYRPGQWPASLRFTPRRLVVHDNELLAIDYYGTNNQYIRVYND